MLWWDRTIIHRIADPAQMSQVRRESEQLRIWRQEARQERVSEQELASKRVIAA
jgi:hypothetical protein